MNIYTEIHSRVGNWVRRHLEIFCPERVTIAAGQGTSEDENLEVSRRSPKPTHECVSVYSLRKNFIANFTNDETKIRAKIAFKTKETKWLDTEDPVIILISIHSAFHHNPEGDLKMNAWVSTIKNHVKGKVTILLADRAHLHAMSTPFDKCLQEANELNSRYRAYFGGCQVKYWHSYVCQDESFERSLEAINLLYDRDALFREYLHKDALFIEEAVKDIIEQCACILVLSKKGYRFQFYPGRPHASTEYINQLLLTPETQVTWIHVFLSIEKKSYQKNCSAVLNKSPLVIIPTNRPASSVIGIAPIPSITKR